MTAQLLGVIGGMGPAATAEFYRALIEATPAQRDQDHLPVVIWADPRVPDRSAALEGRGPDPTAALVHAARTLTSIGATVLAMPCNTAHVFVEAVRLQVDVPFIDMIESTTEAAAEACNPGSTVGILGTWGTVRSEIYHSSLERRGLRAIALRSDEQREWVTPSIRAIKAGQATSMTADKLARAANALVDRGAVALIAGCTEIPLQLAPERIGVALYDPTRCLAHSVVRSVLGVSPVLARAADGCAR